MINIGILSNSNEVIGEGHSIRCARIAWQLLKNGFGCTWYASELTERSRVQIDALGIHIENWSGVILDDVSVLMIDGYLFDIAEIKLNISNSVKIVAIDDLANRYLLADMIIDGNPIQKNNAYDDLSPSKAVKLIGSKYTVLPYEYREIRPDIKRSNSIHIFFGSSDCNSFTYKYLMKLNEALPDYSFNVVVTRLTNKLDSIKALALSSKRITVFEEPDSLMESLLCCEYAIGAPGTSTWERLALRCKCLLFHTSDNQIEILKKLDSSNLIKYLGSADTLDLSILKILNILERKIINLTENIIDVNGSKRIVDAIERMITNDPA